MFNTTWAEVHYKYHQERADFPALLRYNAPGPLVLVIVWGGELVMCWTRNNNDAKHVKHHLRTIHLQWCTGKYVHYN